MKQPIAPAGIAIYSTLCALATFPHSRLFSQLAAVESARLPCVIGAVVLHIKWPDGGGGGAENPSRQVEFRLSRRREREDGSVQVRSDRMSARTANNAECTVR